MSLPTVNSETNNKLVCRICFDEHFDVNCKVDLDEDAGWINLFEFCVGLSLTSRAAPHLLCGKCADNLKDYATFKKQCIKADNHWKSISCNVITYNENIALDKDIKTESPLTVQDLNGDNIENNVECPSPPISSDIIEDNSIVTPTADDDSKELYFYEYVDDVEIENSPGAQEEDNHHYDLRNAKKQGLIKNNSSNPSNEVLECKICRKSYKSKTWLKNHLKSCKIQSKDKSINIEKPNANKKDILKCGLCEFNCKNNEDMWQHLDKHWSSNDLNCKLCDFVGSDLAHLLAHRYQHMLKVKCRFVCHICKNITGSIQSHQFHYRAMHLKKPGGICKYCNREFDCVLRWKKHERTHDTAFICDYCGKKFTQKYNILEHIQLHTGSSKHICPTCGKTFNRDRNLKSHINSVHIKSDPVKCLHCNRMFKSQETYLLHQKYVNAEKVLKCEVCFKGFANARRLKLHMIWHSDERPYTCTICGSGYKQKSQLKIHMRSHTGDKPYKCEHCPCSFTSRNQQKVHVSVHTGVRKYKCHCGRSFHSKMLLRNHSLLRHKEVLDNK